MSDVGALVLTLGERTTARAMASVRSQSLPIAEVVVLDDVTPFYRALNTGAERMTAPFFLQVDADFILDHDCAQTLRDAMAPDVGITVGSLRDPLIGPIAGVKLFRRECFGSTRLGDTIAREVDFYRTLEQNGWQTRYVIGRRDRGRTNTVGAHDPRYTLDYVYGTYYLLGARYALQGDAVGLLWRSSQLRRSRHRLAPVARVAMGHGMFAGETRDVAKPIPAERDTSFLRDLVPPVDHGQGQASTELRDSLRGMGSLSPAAVVDAFLELGASLRATSHGIFRDALRMLDESRDPQSWIAEMGLAHGALARPLSPIPEATSAALERLAAASMSGLFPRPV